MSTLHPTNQLLGRHPELFFGPSTLVVNPPADRFWWQAEAEITAACQEYGPYLLHSGKMVQAVFQHSPRVSPPQPGQIVLYQPKEKKRLRASLSELIKDMGPQGYLYLVGENSTGIKSAVSVLDTYFSEVLKVDSARHCVLYRASQPILDNTDQASVTFSIDHGGKQLVIETPPGVFSYGRLDTGTKLLLRTLPELTAGPTLDFACGSGVIGLALAAANAGLEMDLCDHSAISLAATTDNFSRNGLMANSIFPSDGCSDVVGPYQTVVTNPPFHQGVTTTSAVTTQFIREIGQHLRPRAEVFLVANSFLPYQRELEQRFKTVQILAKKRGFTVYRARH